VIEEDAVDGAVEHHDPKVLVGLDGADQRLELPDHFRAHDVEWRVVEAHPPVRR
jgi:hypothetical protein